MRKVEEIFGGLPLIDRAFKSTLLLTLVQRVRKMLADDVIGRASGFDWLDPDRALELRAASNIKCDLVLLPLSHAQLAQVRAARAEIIEKMPEWTELISLPIRYHRLESSEVVGCSCYAMPQRVFLADAAFVSGRELCEQIIHEHSHNWMYFLEELMPFHRIGYQEVFALPSGTSNRNPTEIIGAAHVCAALIAWYSRLADAASLERVQYLHCYLRGCIEILRSLPSDSLFVAGIEIASLLGKYQEELSKGEIFVS